MTTKTLKTIGLFSGAGGFELGFEQAGLDIKAQCDLYDPLELSEMAEDYESRLQATTTDKERRKIKSDWNKTVKYGADLLSLSARHFPYTQKINGVQNVTRNRIDGTIDVIFGGFPCQDVSIAGNRAGLAGKRSYLWFEFLRIISEFRSQWIVIENVPGLLSSNKGRDFTTIISGLEKCGYWWAYRTLDSQYFGVPQRRRRVFIVASLTKGCPQEVLFERESSPWDASPSRQTGRGDANKIETGIGVNGSSGGDCGGGSEALCIAATLRSSGGDCGGGSETLCIAATSQSGGNGGVPGSRGEVGQGMVLAPTLSTKNEVASSSSQRDKWYNQYAEMFGSVRRLTPLECNRLQGFPNGWTEGYSDSTQYKMMGNAVTVNVARWIAERIKLVTSPNK